MSPTEIAGYAAQVNISSLTTNGGSFTGDYPELAEGCLRARLGEAVGSYCEEVARRGQEPAEQPIPDVLALHHLSGLVTAAELHRSYQGVLAPGHSHAFLTALQARNAKAVAILKAWLAGHAVRETVVIDRSPRQHPQA